MRILHIIYSHSVSGAEKYLDYLLPDLKQYDIVCDLMIICPRISEKAFTDFGTALKLKGIDTVILTAKRRQLLSTLKKINNYLKEKDISIIHSHLLNTDILVSLLKQFFNRKVFIISTKHGYNETVLENYSPDNFKIKKDLYYYITRYTLKKIDKNIAISKGMDDLFYNLKISKEHYPILHHGINVQVVNNEENSSIYRVSDKQLIIAGRLELMKGHKYLLEAFSKVIKQFPECKLLVLGEGSLKETLRQQCERLRIQKNVVFLGFQKDPYSYIQNSDVIILPSLFEPFGLIYIEAHALQTPVVAFDTPAANELMVDDVTGLLVPKADVNQLAEKIILLLNEPAERQRIANNAYQQYLEKFTADIMIKNTAAFYHSLNK